MITGFFLIPTSSWGSKPKRALPCDYRVVIRGIDRRTRFYKHYGQYQTTAPIVVSAAERFGLRVFYTDGMVSRILAPDGPSARAFFTYMQSLGFGKDR